MAEAAIAGGRPGRAAGWGRALFAALALRLAAEGERRLLWLPVFFGAGIGLYFALSFEPPPWLGPAAAVAAGGMTAAFRRHRAWSGSALLLAVLAAGFAWMQLRAWEVGGPMLVRRMGPVVITGRVVDIDALDRGWRLILAPDALPGLAPGEEPRLVRLNTPYPSML
jgi:competence protein ComEC